ncbi:MAG TPA: apolipoprotein N-acyltransferase [Thermodesulfobacteriota bacterium]|nr:apolipoprotein N-acyltransferase [Thermodesulfobacteriota bacterium]
MKGIRRLDLVLAALTGVLYPLTFMIPYSGILSWILLVPLFYAISDKTPKNAFKLGLLAGTLSNLIGTYWLIGTLSRFGGFPIPVSVIFIVILSAFSGLSYALFSCIVTRLGFTRRPGLLSALLIAAVWTSVEYFFPFLFPYGIGNSQADYLPVIQIFDIFGVYGLSFVIVLVNVAITRAILRQGGRAPFPVREIALSAVLVSASLAYGYVRIGQVDAEITRAPKLKIGMVQANFDFLEKSESQEDIVTEKHKEMSLGLTDVDLIIWPETAIQAWFPTDTNYLALRDTVGVPHMEGKYFIVGGMSFTPKEEDIEVITSENVIQYNTAFLTDSEGKILSRYHKNKLLLFGEYLPFSKYFPAIKKISPASGDFTPGDEYDLFEIPEKGARIGPIICYEDILPPFSRKFAEKGANLIINITNDAWFGRTIAPYQHLFVSIPRSIETRKYLLRSTNTGISAIIDPVGRVVAETPTFERMNLEGEVGLMNGENTFYTRIGDVFPAACLVFWAVFGGIYLLKGKRAA